MSAPPSSRMGRRTLAIEIALFGWLPLLGLGAVIIEWLRALPMIARLLGL